MTEKGTRARIAQLEADLKLWQDAYRKLSESMARPSIQTPPPPWPIPVPLPHPQPSPYLPLSPVFVAYAVSFPGSATAQQTGAITVTSTPPKGNEP